MDHEGPDEIVSDRQGEDGERMEEEKPQGSRYIRHAHLYWTVFVLAFMTAFVGAVFWFSTTVAFGVTVGSGIWLFAFIMTVTLGVLLTWTVLTPTIPPRLRLVLGLFGAGIVGVLIYLGVEYRPFSIYNLEFKLGALLGVDSGLKHINFNDLPPAVSERSFVEFMPPPINQGTCGCCWSVATAGTLSARMNRSQNLTSSSLKSCTGFPYEQWQVSPQSLLDASVVRSNGVGKCNDNYYAEGFRIARDTGFQTSQCVPFFAGDEPNCKTWCGSPKIKTERRGNLVDTCVVNDKSLYVWNRCTTSGLAPRLLRSKSAYLIKGEETMKREISHNGPIMCTVNFYTKSSGHRAIWTLAGKSSSVYVSPGFVAKPSMDGNEYTKDFKEGGHNLIIFGYGHAGDGTPYWDVQNSWGSNWGVSGRCKIQRGVDAWNIESFCVAGTF
ncbi:MAG: hypothetical protein K0U52_13595 [Gammaproteobacteria bacterium]|nr:hypothetical protein [Gammaproteobacteria bacterium]